MEQSNVFQVPGRMGMVVTLCLITANIYNSVDAPKTRGFSYIEIWILGAQFPIILGLLEYGFILHLMKYFKFGAKVGPVTMDSLAFEDKVKKLDYFTMAFNVCFFTLFNVFYWTLH